MTTYDDMMILGWRMRQGYSGYRGFGDAASDYVADHARWVSEKAAYDTAYANWQNTTIQLKTTYALATNRYQLALVRWRAAAAAYNTAVANYQNAIRSQSFAYQNNQSALAQQGVVFPDGYPGCVSQAQHDAWQRTCDSVSSVKGLGALPTGPACVLTQVSVCQPAPAAPTPPGAQPAPPAAPSYPAPPPPVRPEPQAPPPVPVQSTVPTPTPVIPTPTSSTLPTSTPSVLTPTYQSTTPLLPTTPATTSASTKSGGLLSNGLLLVVLAGGSYALYRTFRKPKAAA